MTIEKSFIEDSVIKMNISKYLSNELSRAGFSRVDIQKTPVITRITLYVLNPGRVIGRGGKTIDTLTESIKKRFGIDNPQISVVEVENRMLEPLLVAKMIAEKLERGINPRRLLQSTLRSIIENGALGAEIRIGGKLVAKKARSKSIIKSVGYMPKAGNVTELVREAVTAAYPKYGAIGIQVRIVPPGTVFPDKDVKNLSIPKAIMTY
ncbi:MAG: 30S ribosomal protein S3 [Candidatus Marsarchaeota archaeon]|nr:30S ribosomal protein S3 [Candidatus Marsarchaeota archaeon]MCL5112558.1 30S ribosomal protein S3 [Candidatus Marsarchaeota archaeon]